ncbi:hypothetical protein G6F70_005555 [Rhizopus microsporus]|uniref:Phospholipase B1, membrane-associated n=2 Tax=Rhizopus TaxID=4842 RepID=A0A367KE11_RHIAZ|nr:hypothetical protein G6F71_003451 [Rhizopus microsporus]RCI00473.1 hypothetical protein CU097_004590 [Rhizopus azygosporus]KAG1198731.1 hypothetical protein G6F70_005555 [Rhizopus microsporus]KAG1211848.1 hypothetical protein G6F69_004243 [Rhizopus microsporus]KAG1230351.1 hypothetical protein G6F67_006519 [Rhizopus microsporus]
MVQFKLLALPLLVAVGTVFANVQSISDCPALPPRKSPPKDVTDLRPDDIKVVAALGDSIMAGFAMMGVNYGAHGTGIVNFTSIMEFRGNSYGIGGDTDAVTLANFVKHYSPNVKGASRLAHIVSYCSAKECTIPESFYRPLIDNLNGAQSGAIAMNLDYELDYLIPRMKSYFKKDEDFKKAWKFITIQIGSNDQCDACSASEKSKYVTPELYGKYVNAALQRIQKEIPRVVVNLLGTFKVSNVLRLTAGHHDYCPPNGILENTKECACGTSEEGLKAMDATSEAYNKQLEKIAAKYPGKPGGSFAVMYSPAPIDILSFPIDAISNIDCFHPSLKGHQWIAKNFWNQIFLSKDKKPKHMKFDDKLKIYCPTENDRFPTA